MPVTLLSSSRTQRPAEIDDQLTRKSPSSHTSSRTVTPQARPPQHSNTQTTPVVKNGVKVAENFETEHAEDDRPESSDIIDQETFGQIIDLDDDEDHEFSKNMVYAFFTQAESTFADMEAALKNKDLPKLSELGHFLKGSSSALGVTKVQNACEKIQHYGLLWDEEAKIVLTAVKAENLIRKLLVVAKTEYSIAEKWLKTWFEENSSRTEDDP